MLITDSRENKTAIYVAVKGVRREGFTPFSFQLIYDDVRGLAGENLIFKVADKVPVVSDFERTAFRCILIICIGICVGFGAAFLAVLFILRPDGKTVRSGSAVHAARRARCFGVHFWPTKGVYGLTLQETALPCVTCRRYNDRASEAPS